MKFSISYIKKITNANSNIYKGSQSLIFGLKLYINLLPWGSHIVWQ